MISRKKQSKLVAIGLLLVVLLSIGYAYISTTLSINGISNILKTSWSVYFDNVQVKEGSVTATTAPTVPTGSKTTTELTYEVEMSTPGDFYEFTVDVKNDGTLDAMLDSINLSSLNLDQAKYLDYEVTYADGGEIAQYDKLEKETQETIKVGVYYKKDVTPEDLPTANDSITLTVAMNYVQADENAKARIQTRAVTNADIGKYVDLGKDVIGTEATDDDWRVLWVDETNSRTYLILADYLPASKMPSATGIENNGEYSVYSTVDRDTLLNYMTTSSNWSSLIDSSIQGATVTGGTTVEVMEASYTTKYGGSWDSTTAEADTLLLPHPDGWNSCYGYWLASPSNDPNVCCVDYDGIINSGNSYYAYFGVRSVVCVSSDTSLAVVE